MLLWQNITFCKYLFSLPAKIILFLIRMICMTWNSWPHIWQIETYQMDQNSELNTCFWTTDDVGQWCQQQQTGKSFHTIVPSGPRKVCAQLLTVRKSHRKFHSNSTSYKDEQYDTFTSCYYSDCFTVMMKLVSLTEIIIIQICLNFLKVYFMHTTVYDWPSAYINMKT